MDVVKKWVADTEKKLRAVNLSCVRQYKVLFSSLSFTLSTSQLLIIEGANGTGKSSLLRLLTGLATPFAGEIFWDEKNIQQARLEYSQDLHYVSHQNGIKLGLTVNENLQLAKHLNLSTAALYEPVLTSLQLHQEQHTQSKFLSAGQRRRLALAKLLLLPKRLWILDEPLTALDRDTQTFFLSQLSLHLKNGGMAIMSSHQAIPIENVSKQIIRLNEC